MVDKKVMIKFLSKINVIPFSDCWEWAGATDKDGYGIFHTYDKAKKRHCAHRFSYGLFRNDPPKGKCVCHRCDNVSCVNPKHLFIATHQENIKDRTNKMRSRGGFLSKTGLNKHCWWLAAL